jgi:hypothetical protein
MGKNYDPWPALRDIREALIRHGALDPEKYARIETAGARVGALVGSVLGLQTIAIGDLHERSKAAAAAATAASGPDGAAGVEGDRAEEVREGEEGAEGGEA